MDDDQQFCLRWNNHQSTLISVFDTLLENETLVDCTLAAEGKFLKAHKVVLSACSPYFATLLSEQYDKHPIFILKDVKYQELRAMMDYMYRGEVNISQDQLAALLKAAESLQIKGLSDNRSSGNNSQKSADHKQHVPGKLIGGGGSSGLGGGLGGISGIGGGVASSIGSGYTLEQTKRARVGPSSIDSQDMSRSREGSSSPTSRRRRKIRRRSIENTMSDIHENSNSSQIQIQQSSVPTQSSASNILGGVSAIAAAAAAAAAAAGMTTNIASSGTVLSSASQQQQQHTSASTSLSSLAAASSTTPGSLATAAAAAAAAQTSGNLITTNVTKKTESVSKIIGNTDAMNMDNIPDDNEKDVITKKDQQQNNHKQQRLSKLIDTSSSSVAGKDTDMVIEPKSEYDDDANDETVEDLTLDDEEMGLEDLDHNAGPSHGGEGSSQGYGQWPIDRSQDEVFMAAQEAQQRDPQDLSITRIAGLTWSEWNARLAMPLVTQLRIDSNLSAFPTDLSINSMDKHNNSTTSNTAAASPIIDQKSPTNMFLSPNNNNAASLLVATTTAAASATAAGTTTTTTIASTINANENLRLSGISVSATITTNASIKTISNSGNHHLLKISGSGSSATGNNNTSNSSSSNDLINNSSNQIDIQKNNDRIKVKKNIGNNDEDDDDCGDGTIGIGGSTIGDNSFCDDNEGNENISGSDYQSLNVGAFADVKSSSLNLNILSSISAMNNLISGNGGGVNNSSSNSVGGGGGGGGGIGNNSVGNNGVGHPCQDCGRVYKLKSSLRNHQKWECGKEPQFQCPFCVYRAKQKMHIGRHMERMHKEKFIKLEDIKSYTGGDEPSSLSQHFS